MERNYAQKLGVFAPPVWPPSIPVQQKVIDENKALKDAQSHLGIAVLLEAAVLSASQAVDAGQVCGIFYHGRVPLKRAQKLSCPP